jgi:hypothetical protein
MATLRSEIAERGAKITLLESTLSATESVMATLRSEVAERGAKITLLESTLSALYASTSWRISAPLRYTKRLLQSNSTGAPTCRLPGKP